MAYGVIGSNTQPVLILVKQQMPLLLSSIEEPKGLLLD